MNDDFVVLDKALSNFIEQEDHATLILIGSNNDTVVPARLLNAKGRQSETAVYLICIDPCNSITDWMNGFMQQLQLQVTGANGLLVKEGLAPWPPLPMECMNPNLPAAQRFKAAALYCAERIPESERPVWILLPGECNDRMGYAALASSLCGSDPWLDKHRFIVWDDRTQPVLVPALRKAKNKEAVFMNIDFSAQKQLSDLVEVAKNRALPVPERMEALFQLAAVDFAYKRYAEADTKYAQLFDYYKGKDKVHQVMCLQGSGDIATQQKNSTLALKRYLSGIAIAVEEELPLVMLPLFKGAAEAYLALGNYQLAEGYFDHAVTIAGKLSNVNTQADTLEQRGISQLNQRLGQKALESFDACWKLCERVGYEQRWQSALERLQQLYQQASMYQEAINVENRLKKGFPLAPAETESTKEYV